MTQNRIILLTLPLALALLALLALAAVGTVSLIRRAREAAHQTLVEVGMIRGPQGFTVELYATTSASLPTLLTFDPEGRLLVLTVDGRLFRYTDEDGDGVAETERRIYDNPDNRVFHAVGLAFYEGVLYLSHSAHISTLADRDGDGVYDQRTTIIEGLPSLLFPDHSNNAIAFGPDGKLYVGVGATTDHGPLQNPLEASVLRMNPDGSELEVFATGFRNPYDIVFSPAGDLFASENNPSEFSEMLQYLPPEEVNHVRQGRDYGFPNYYGNPPPGMRFPASEGTVTELYASVGSAGLTYYADGPFPARYHDGLFVAQWGTGANVALDRGISNGQQVVFIRLEPTADGTFTGTWEPFVDFNKGAGNPRPVDVAVGPDGALYILEWTRSVVYRVSYTGGESETAAVEASPTPSPIPPPPPSYPPELVAQGEALFRSGAPNAPACLACHVLEPGQPALGPALLGLYVVAGNRVDGLSAEAYVRQSIEDPNAYVVHGYNANYMYLGYSESLDDTQLDALTAYILSLPATGP